MIVCFKLVVYLRQNAPFPFNNACLVSWIKKSYLKKCAMPVVIVAIVVVVVFVAVFVATTVLSENL